jgi:hypothetical protein
MDEEQQHQRQEKEVEYEQETLPVGSDDVDKEASMPRNRKFPPEIDFNDEDLRTTTMAEALSQELRANYYSEVVDRDDAGTVAMLTIKSSGMPAAFECFRNYNGHATIAPNVINATSTDDIQNETGQKPGGSFSIGEKKFGSGRDDIRQAFLVFMLMMLVSVLTTHAFASPLPSPSSASWWEGMEFNDNADITDQESNLHLSKEPLIQVPCGLILAGPGEEDVLPLSTMIDTSLPKSSIHSSALKRYPQLQALIRHTSKQESSSFYIPAGALKLRMGSVEATTASPALLLVHHDCNDTADSPTNFELNLGMDFLREHGAVLDVGEEELKLLVPKSHDPSGNKNEVFVYVVPFIRPRPTLDFGDGNGADL